MEITHTPDLTITHAKGTEYYNNNRSIDRDNKNGITKKEIAYRVDNYIRRGKRYATTLL